jgi:parallel beta-helix repeat protein
MNLRTLCTLLGTAVCLISTAANAAVHRVYPGESIQAAIDAASPGDTILVEPGEYYEDGSSRYGLRIATDNLRLIGKVKKGQGDAGKVRLIANGAQETGILAAPAGCEYNWTREQCEAAIGPDFEDLKGFYIRGFTVEDFPENGIQTRWVDGFEFARNESARNLENGIYPTLSANGLVRNNESYGSLDTAMWVAGSENVRVIGNELHSSVIGFEITVSNEVQVIQNEIYNNTVGVGLFHPNGAGNPPLPVMANWEIEHNDIYDNNLPNAADPEDLEGILPPGIGILVLGVSDHVIAKNNVEDNDYVGIGVLGWCTALAGSPRDCGDGSGLRWPPQANNNLISQNYVNGNGGSPPAGAMLPAVDLLYAQFEPGAGGNCFMKNKPSGYTYFSSEPDGELPTDGCRLRGPNK